MPLEESNSSVNQSSAEPVTPVAAAQTPTPNKKLRPINISKHGLFFLSAIAVIFLVVLVFIMFEKSKSDSGLKLANASLSSKYADFLKQADSATNKADKAKFLISAFTSLSLDYQQDPTAQKYAELKKFSDMLYKDFPQEAKEARIAIVCQEESCGAKYTYSDLLNEVKTRIGDLKVDAITKQSLIDNLQNAAAYVAQDDVNGQFSALAADFSILKDEWVKNKDPQIKQLAELVGGELKRLNSSAYESGYKYGIYNLEK